MRAWILTLSLLLGCVLFALCTGDVSAAGETGGGYLAGYQEADPRPSAVSWWSTVAYVVSLFAVFAFVVILAYLVARAFGKNSMRTLADRSTYSCRLVRIARSAWWNSSGVSSCSA